MKNLKTDQIQAKCPTNLRCSRSSCEGLKEPFVTLEAISSPTEWQITVPLTKHWIQKIRCVSVRVSLWVSVCVCRGLRCSWEGLALLDCILPVLLLELDTFFHTHRPADGQTERWEWRKSVQPDYLKEATRFLLLHIFLELIFWRNTGMKMLYIKAVHAGLKGIA